MRDKVLGIVEQWNKKYPPGTRVHRYLLANPLDYYWGETVTKSEAWVGVGGAMVFIRGMECGVPLDSLVVIEEA